jgi:hypothetical protein
LHSSDALGRNEPHGDFLACDRLDERRAGAARRALVAASGAGRDGGPWRRLAARVTRLVRLLL